jgi:hypothetical protein
MDAVLGHGFHPLKARQRRSIPNLQTVHRHGRIPFCGQCLTGVVLVFSTNFVPIPAALI